MTKPCLLVAIVAVMLCLLMGQPLMAQKARPEPTKPSWIAMMDDPNVNYHEAVKAFDTYWKNREKPTEEEERFGSVQDKEKEEKIKQKEKKLNDNDPAKLYAFEYKKFLWWKREMEPFVQTDGHIKSMDQRINEWKEQKQQKKGAGNKN